MDQVYIEALKVQTLIGVYDFEREAQQDLFLDLRLDFDCRRAGLSDDLKHALDYDRLSRRIREWSSKQTFQLLEMYAEKLCQLVNEEFDIQRVRLTINKPAAVEDCSAVGISIERQFGD